MSIKVKLEIEKRLIDRLQHLESGRKFNGTSYQQARSLVDLYMAYIRSQRKNWPQLSETESVEINRSTSSNLLSFINLDPFIGPVRKAITALMGEDVKKALAILQKIVDEQDKIIGEIQGKNRRGKTKDSAFKSLLREILKKNPDLSALGVLKELKKRNR